MIFDAAQRLALKKDLDRITVKDIAEECQITRQTFYYHFQDIFAMVEWGLGEELKRLIAKGKNTETMEDALLLYCEIVMEKRVLFSKMLNSRYCMPTLQMVRELLKQYMLGVLEKNHCLIDALQKI